MKGIAITGLVLVVLGLEALFYGGFSYFVDHRQADKGLMTLSAKHERQYMTPLWGGTASVALGGLLLLLGRRQRKDPR